MDAGRSRSRDVVGTFLDTVGDSRSASQTRPPSTSSWPSAEPTSEAPAAIDDGSEFEAESETETSSADAAERVEPMRPSAPSIVGTVLGRLTDRDHLLITELAAELDVSILEIANVLEKLNSAGLIEIGGTPGREMVRLTESGRTVAGLS